VQIKHEAATHAESVSSVLDEDVPDAAVLVEELLDVALADVVRQVAQEHPAPFSRWHLDDLQLFAIISRKNASVRFGVVSINASAALQGCQLFLSP
jgi:hypothetical protein